MADKIQFRRDTKERWESYNPVLAEGEIGFVIGDENLYKVGDGVHKWKDLSIKGFSGNIFNELGSADDSVISQAGLTNILDGIVNNKSQVIINNDWSPIDNLAESGIYSLKEDSDSAAYQMFVSKEYQWIFGNLKIDDDGKIRGNKLDDKCTIVFRSRVNDDWSSWQYIQSSFISNSSNNNDSDGVSVKLLNDKINELKTYIQSSNNDSNVSADIKSLRESVTSLQSEIKNMKSRLDELENLLSN
jgi:hypothetical protein